MRYLIGIGNYYGRDDSIGLRIAEHIGEAGLDRGFRVIDLGGNLLDLVHYLDAESEAVLIVDSARMGIEPGEYAFFTPDQVASVKGSAGFSTHEGDLLKVLEFAAAAATSPLPPVTIMGIEPAELADEPGISRTLETQLDEYVAAAVRFIAADDAGTESAE
ncbi:MAG: hydrogenase maturation protease [Coriobacteriia bacterium]|nr:hydrogenase maturation protease [Coriobacteriia bacterium]